MKSTVSKGARTGSKLRSRNANSNEDLSGRGITTVLTSNVGLLKVHSRSSLLSIVLSKKEALITNCLVKVPILIGIPTIPRSKEETEYSELAEPISTIFLILTTENYLLFRQFNI